MEGEVVDGEVWWTLCEATCRILELLERGKVKYWTDDQKADAGVKKAHQHHETVPQPRWSQMLGRNEKVEAEPVQFLVEAYVVCRCVHVQTPCHNAYSLLACVRPGIIHHDLVTKYYGSMASFAETASKYAPILFSSLNHLPRASLRSCRGRICGAMLSCRTLFNISLGTELPPQWRRLLPEAL